MSLLSDLSDAAARMIAKNEGRAEPNESDRAHGDWAMAGVLAYWRQRPDEPPPVQAPAPGPPPAPDRHGGGNIHERGPTALGGDGKVLREVARAKGYTGDSCQDCGNFTLVRNGTCLKCDSCGATTGCS